MSSRKPPVGTKIEFLLIYTELDSYIKWKQASFPLNQPKTSDYVLGYENISIHFTDSDCGGLYCSNSESRLFDSCRTSLTYYFIGFHVKHSEKWNYTFPVPKSELREMSLWMRIFDLCFRELIV